MNWPDEIWRNCMLKCIYFQVVWVVHVIPYFSFAFEPLTGDPPKYGALDIDVNFNTLCTNQCKIRYYLAGWNRSVQKSQTFKSQERKWSRNFHPKISIYLVIQHFNVLISRYYLTDVLMGKYYVMKKILYGNSTLGF